jgi:hypothetical protein
LLFSVRPSLHLQEHLFDVGCGERVSNGSPDDLELLARVTQGFATPRRTESLADPLGDSHALETGEALNLSQFPVVQKDLQAFTHRNSLINSWE